MGGAAEASMVPQETANIQQVVAALPRLRSLLNWSMFNQSD
jgi:hypothetical protein